MKPASSPDRCAPHGALVGRSMLRLWENGAFSSPLSAKEGAGLRCGLARLEQRVDDFARHRPFSMIGFQHLKEFAVSEIFRRDILVEDFHYGRIE